MGWWKNTYFWIAFILLIIGLVGLARGAQVIADPGRDVDPTLGWKYLLAALIMIVNGVLSHKQYLREQAKRRTAKESQTPREEA